MSLMQVILHEYRQTGYTRIHNLVSKSIGSPWRYAIDAATTDSQEDFSVKNLLGEVTEDCHAAVLCMWYQGQTILAFADAL